MKKQKNKSERANLEKKIKAETQAYGIILIQRHLFDINCKTLLISIGQNDCKQGLYENSKAGYHCALNFNNFC